MRVSGAGRLRREGQLQRAVNEMVWLVGVHMLECISPSHFAPNQRSVVKVRQVRMRD